MRVCYWSGLVTWMSRAAGQLQLQLRRNTSAGRERKPGTRPGVSLQGPRAAASCAAEKTTSLRELCLAMRSPLAADLVVPKNVSHPVALRTGVGAVVEGDT